jgi:hypothetical protein
LPSLGGNRDHPGHGLVGHLEEEVVRKLLLNLGLSMLGLGLVACGQGGPGSFKRDLPPAGAILSRAYKEVIDKHYATNPPKTGECSKEVHARYWTYGPDGKVYPTWHPPVDPDTGCAFGHEHGRDPSGSNLISIGLPFGYTNEVLYDAVQGDATRFRDEDHVGHKVEWKNDVVVENRNGAFDGREYARCDFLIKLHQGTHSADALTNNLHELFYYARCSDGTALQWRNLNAFGKAGHVHRNCSNDQVQAGTPVPPTSPDGGGNRDIPDRKCADDRILVGSGQTSDFGSLNENWPMGVGGWADNGKLQFSFGPYFQVRNPSRFTDLSQTGKIGRPIDLCYVQGDKMARGKDCDNVRAAAPDAANGMKFDDPRSPWNGTRRVVDINGLNVSNVSGENKWFTDAFGKNLSRQRDAAKGVMIEQFIAKGGTADVKLHPLRNNNIGGDHDHPTVHAPN